MGKIIEVKAGKLSYALLLVFLLFGIGGNVIGGEPIARIISTRIICSQPDKYIGWATIVKTKKGELIVVFSGDRDAHVCPWGKTQMVKSTNNGNTWSDPITINNTPLDDRDAGIIQTSKGTLLVSWFTSLAFDNFSEVAWQKLPQLMLDGWKRHIEKIGPDTRKQWLGNWIRRSVDGGDTWGKYIDSIVTAPHGPVELTDGRLLYVGINHKKGDKSIPQPLAEKLIAAAESRDDGQTWKIIGYIPVPNDLGTKASDFVEPHLVETTDGKLVAMLRHRGTFLWQTESHDGGKTWTVVHQTNIVGRPPHLIHLKNNWLLVSYGRRREPYSERACISRDSGKTWDVDNEITLTSAPNGDLGYPTSVQLDDGSILTIYYQVAKSGEKTCLMGTHWRLEP
ncbi:MAG TPA: exo-alpha-sialidase [bacterium]|nr:exo-alpha-sialidase [bacterium]